jgi:hypothetical protein
MAVSNIEDHRDAKTSVNFHNPNKNYLLILTERPSIMTLGY